MAEKTPVIRTVSWPAVVVQMLLLAFLIKVFSWMGFVNPFPFLIGPFIYLLFAFGLRGWMEDDHRKGMRAVKKQNYHAALEHFEASIEFFDSHPRVDKYRALTLLSASRFTFREMGMVNMAYCYGQMGRGEEMIELYRRVAKEYPDNEIAITALRMIDSVGRE